MKLHLLAAIACVASLAGAADLAPDGTTFNGKTSWTFAKLYPGIDKPLQVYEGDLVHFKWEGLLHDVTLMSDYNNCSSWIFPSLTPQTQSYEYIFNATGRLNTTTSMGCTVYGHCAGGLRVAIEVVPKPACAKMKKRPACVRLGVCTWNAKKRKCGPKKASHPTKKKKKKSKRG